MSGWWGPWGAPVYACLLWCLSFAADTGHAGAAEDFLGALWEKSPVGSPTG